MSDNAERVLNALVFGLVVGGGWGFLIRCLEQMR